MITSANSNKLWPWSSITHGRDQCWNAIYGPSGRSILRSSLPGRACVRICLTLVRSLNRRSGRANNHTGKTRHEPSLPSAVAGILSRPSIICPHSYPPIEKLKLKKHAPSTIHSNRSDRSDGRRASPDYSRRPTSNLRGFDTSKQGINTRSQRVFTLAIWLEVLFPSCLAKQVITPARLG